MTKHPVSLLVITLLLFTAVGCVSAKTGRTILETGREQSVIAENLDCCDDFQQQITRLECEKEVIILVHGCNASSGYFLTLKQVFAARGQQAICFSYDFRDSIEKCSARLVRAINLIDGFLNPAAIIIVAHSQGGLVARRAIIADRTDGLALNINSRKIRIVTISSPFNGIKASSHCGITALHIATAGVTVAICQLIAGSTWSEIYPGSGFISHPGTLADAVTDHIKINTDEADTCRRVNEDGSCRESDYVFALDEQYAPPVDDDSRVLNIELRAGHAQIVGKPGRPPFELIEVLEEQGILRMRTTLTRAEETALFLALYR
jgi:hypothetical protein